MKTPYLFWLRTAYFIPAVLCLLFFTACDSEQNPPYSIKHTPAYQDPVRLQQAWSLPVAGTYQGTFEYQINGTFCGPASVVNAFNSLGINKYTQNTLFEKSSISYWKTRILGLTLDELATLVQNNSDVVITVLRNISLDEFRKHLTQSNNPSQRYLINFDRASLFGVNIGHHSPIGGYLVEQDLVFVLDVLEDYKPFLVPSERLYQAMNTLDGESNQKRGLLLISPI